MYLTGVPDSHSNDPIGLHVIEVFVFGDQDEFLTAEAHPGHLQGVAAQVACGLALAVAQGDAPVEVGVARRGPGAEAAVRGVAGTAVRGHYPEPLSRKYGTTRVENHGEGLGGRTQRETSLVLHLKEELRFPGSEGSLC